MTTGPSISASRPRRLALVLSGGGARAAHQVGVLRWLGRAYPELRFPIITGISAGAINALYLAQHRGNLHDATNGLAELWLNLSFEDVFRTDLLCLVGNVARTLLGLGSGGSQAAPAVRALLDARPLYGFLSRALGTPGPFPGIAANLADGRLRGVALGTVDYATGQTVTWVEAIDEIDTWRRPLRRSQPTRLKVDHALASAALPIIFPAVEVDGRWYGDGGIRHAAPLSPALHLGATDILAVSTRYQRSLAEAELPAISGYPPPAQILGNLLNAIFLDVLDQDAHRLERLNEVLERLPPDERGDQRLIDLLLLRPSSDLGRMVAGFEPTLPRGIRFLTRGLGTRDTESPDVLSLLMFQQDYVRRLIDIGEADAAANRDELDRLIQEGS
ncbi:MAG: patatin-like phospholipase family protein [Acidobacteriota bacterium]